MAKLRIFKPFINALLQQDEHSRRRIGNRFSGLPPSKTAKAVENMGVWQKHPAKAGC